MAPLPRRSEGVVSVDGKYAPRYSVGDRFLDGLGAAHKIVEIHKASAEDRAYTRWAASVGWTYYDCRETGTGGRMIITTTTLHEEIDTGHGEWAYVGPAN